MFRFFSYWYASGIKKTKKKKKEKENGAAPISFLSFKKKTQMNDWAERDGWWRRTIEVDRTERPRRSGEEKEEKKMQIV